MLFSIVFVLLFCGSVYLTDYLCTNSPRLLEMPRPIVTTIPVGLESTWTSSLISRYMPSFLSCATSSSCDKSCGCISRVLLLEAISTTTSWRNLVSYTSHLGRGTFTSSINSFRQTLLLSPSWGWLPSPTSITTCTRYNNHLGEFQLILWGNCWVRFCLCLGWLYNGGKYQWSNPVQGGPEGSVCHWFLRWGSQCKFGTLVLKM